MKVLLVLGLVLALGATNVEAKEKIRKPSSGTYQAQPEGDKNLDCGANSAEADLAGLGSGEITIVSEGFTPKKFALSFMGSLTSRAAGSMGIHMNGRCDAGKCVLTGTPSVSLFRVTFEKEAAYLEMQDEGKWINKTQLSCYVPAVINTYLKKGSL